ncbi:MAG: hypothetical protein GXX96_04355 [Planctomycetaceae bacterium]|nr:hypothetical protein [Planctomycetaceae bacterium]
MQPCQAETGTDGLWRDGKLLVMRNQSPRFPQRCIKTNLPYAGPPTRLKLTWLENETLWVLLVGAIGRAAVMATDGKKIWVDLPISHAWLAKRRRSAIVGWGLLLGGIASFILAVVGYVAATVSGINEESVVWLMVFILGGPLVALYAVNRNS